MKKIKVFARKLSLFLMAAALAFVTLPSNLAFAEGNGYNCPQSDEHFTSMNFLVINEVEDDGVGEFTFQINAQSLNADSLNEFQDFSDQFGEPVSSGVYEFTLKSDEEKELYICHGYSYTIREIPTNGWNMTGVDMFKNSFSCNKIDCFSTRELVQTSEENVVVGNTVVYPLSYHSSGVDYELFFKKRKTVTDSDSRISNENTNEQTTNIFSENKSELAVPNTGENTGGFSATRTGIVAFAVVVTFGRVAYLIRKYQKDRRK